MLIYRGQIPSSMPLDANLPALGDGAIKYPLRYGYACVGRVEQVGSSADEAWVGRTVFSFQPHASHFVSDVSELIQVPDDVDPEAAVYLANMDTAVNLLQDARPQLGDRVIVLGQGILGLLVGGILSEFPLTALYGVDQMSQRRARAKNYATACFDPNSPADINVLKNRLYLDQTAAERTSWEITGPGRVEPSRELCATQVASSSAAAARSTFKLGELFHRNRISIVSSYCQHHLPELRGRWNKERRLSVAWDRIRKLEPQQFIAIACPFRSPRCLSLARQCIRRSVQIVSTIDK